MAGFPKLQDYLKSMEWADHDRRWLIDYWANAAIYAGVPAKEYFKALVNDADLTDKFKQQVADIWLGDAAIDAGRLFQWARKRGVNPKDGRFTTLASVIIPCLENAGSDQALVLAALIIKYNLIVGHQTAERFARRYQLPSAAAPPEAEERVGPDFNWDGPDDELTLQGLFRATPIGIDVKFLTLVLVAASAVCRIETDVGDGSPPIIRGTGFLIAPNLVITNYHVLGESDEDVSSAAKIARLHFGALTNLEKGEDAGQVVPVVAALEMSRTSEDDYVLLQADPSIANCKGLIPVVLSAKPPSDGSGLHILHHPGGGPMKLCISNNGIAKILGDQGKIQYVSQTASGSSGSPCFNDEFQVIAIHHAAQWKFGGAVGEGIMISAIRERLKRHL